MTKDEALRLALEALSTSMYPQPRQLNAIAAIKAALEAKDEPEQMAKLGWQVIDCPICGGGARAFPKQEVKDEPVAHSVVAGALFDFMGWLTSREKRLILSSVDEASPAVEAITEFAKKRNLSLKYAEVGYWTEFLSTPPQQEAKDEPVKIIAYNCKCGRTMKFESEHGIVAPQRTWIGLTDEEIEQGCKESWVTEQAFQSAVWWAEAKLKEKNT